MVECRIFFSRMDMIGAYSQTLEKARVAKRNVGDAIGQCLLPFCLGLTERTGRIIISAQISLAYSAPHMIQCHDQVKRWDSN